MGIIIYQKAYDTDDALDNFMDILFSSQMEYFASDLYGSGFTYSEILEATARAIRAAKSSGIVVRQHFMPMYSQKEQGLIRDCKLTRLGYAMVLMNASPDRPAVGYLQVQILNKFLKN